MRELLLALGRALAHYINQPVRHYEPRCVHDTAALHYALEPADVLLVEGNRRVSTAIKYLTQSTWSHAAMYVGDATGLRACNGEPLSLIEADIERGVIAVPVSDYADFNTRICHPVGLSPADRRCIVGFMVASLGKRYDLKNVLDLARYLLPTPPVPVRFRRRLLALGSGDPTRAVCSSLIAQAFQQVRYPILPRLEVRRRTSRYRQTREELFHIRHHSLFTPRDFDVSPYFEIVKPTLRAGFRYTNVRWAAADDSPTAKQ